MKKTIFDLNYKEGKKMDLALRRTSYFQQYLRIYIIGVCVTGLMIIISTIALDTIKPPLADVYELFIYLFGFACILILSVLFGFKRFDLVKKYYEEKVEK